MYISGMIIAFILSFIVLFIQAIIRRKLEDEDEKSFFIEFFGLIAASAVYSILSWLTVAIMIIMLMGGKVRWISDKNS